MTAQQALSTWPAIKAFGERRPIQFSNKGVSCWTDYSGYCPNFDSINLEWREKPSARVRFTEDVLK